SAIAAPQTADFPELLSGDHSLFSEASDQQVNLAGDAAARDKQERRGRPSALPGPDVILSRDFALQTLLPLVWPIRPNLRACINCLTLPPVQCDVRANKAFGSVSFWANRNANVTKNSRVVSDLVGPETA
ncbi:MAG: hypothetical protein AAF661_08810, partial [Pseudomonadota bacterium]